MVRRAPDGQEGSGALGEAARNEGVATTGLPPFAAVFVPQLEAIGEIIDRLPGFALLPVEVPSRDVALSLAQWLALQGRAVQLVDRGAEWRTLTAAIAASAPAEGGVVMVLQPSGLDRHAFASALRLLNQRRDTVAGRLKGPLLWCGDGEFLRRTAELSPDFWSVREVPVRIVIPQEYAPLSANMDAQLTDVFSRVFEDDEKDVGQPRKLFTGPGLEDLKRDARLFLQRSLGARENPRLMELSLAILRASDDLTGLGLGLLISGEAALAGHRLDDAEAHLREAIALLRQTGQSYEVVRATIALSHVLRRTRRAAESEALLRGVFRLAEEVDDWNQQAELLVNLAIVQLDMKQPVSALESLDRARSRLDRIGDDESLAAMLAVRAKALEQTADLDGAAHAIDEAAEIFGRTQSALQTLAALIVSADIHLARGDSERALQSLRSAFSRVKQKREALTLTRLMDLTRKLPDSMASKRDALLAEMDARLGHFSH